MTNEMIALATIGAICGFVSLRPIVLNGMMRARRADFAALACEIDLLCQQGQIDRNSAFYRYHHDLAWDIAEADFVPGLLTVWWAQRNESRNSSPVRSVSYAEVHAQLDSQSAVHRRLANEFMVRFIELYTYRSLIIWLLLKGVIALALTVGAGAVVYGRVGRLMDALARALEAPAPPRQNLQAPA
jgi:hypothetical protein